MSAKNIVIASIITALLTGCGGGAANQPPALSDDGTYTDTAPTTSDDYGSDTSYDPSADATLPEDSTDTASPDASASPGATTKSYTLMGKVLDAAGKAIVGASVSIGSQTVLTDSSGVYNIPGITDNKVFVSVTKTGFDSLSGISVALDADASTTTTTKSFELAEKSGSDDEDTEAGLHHELTFSTADFKSVSSMVALDGNVYVLGVLDGLLFDSKAVVSFSEDGNKIESFKKIGFLKSLPKDATYLAVDDDQLVVSNASTGYIFNTSGDFLESGSAVKTSPLEKVKDTDHGITYEISGSNKVDVTYDGDTVPYKLDEVGHASALALDSDNNLLVLDSTNKVVHQFSFEPADD